MTSNTPTRLTVEEAIESLTGYEEVAVHERFGAYPDDLIGINALRGMRALAFVLTARELKRADAKNPDAKAYEQVMAMTLKQVSDFFPDVDDEVMPEEPVTDTGKGDSQPG